MHFPQGSRHLARAAVPKAGDADLRGSGDGSGAGQARAQTKSALRNRGTDVPRASGCSGRKPARM